MRRCCKRVVSSVHCFLVLQQVSHDHRVLLFLVFFVIVKRDKRSGLGCWGVGVMGESVLE